MPSISNLVKSIQEIMRKHAGTYDDAQRIEQMAWHCCLKIIHDVEGQFEIGNTFKNPKFSNQQGKLRTFDRVVADAPDLNLAA